MAVWMPVTSVPTSLATVAMATFITEVSRVIRNWPAASVSSTIGIAASHDPRDEAAAHHLERMMSGLAGGRRHVYVDLRSGSAMEGQLTVRRDKEWSRGALGAWLLLAVALLALAVPAARADAAPAVPLIVDTDIFSDADDVGALAIAHALQIRGEAKLIGVSVNTNVDRGEVATDSWRCVAAINAFYGSASVPIGTAMPNARSTAGDADFATPCAHLAPASTPAPVSAVDMYRQALAAQPDHSVVISSGGYLSNLSDLLNSGPDAKQLIADKVKTLVVMGGGYPIRGGETNLTGNPPAAQDVMSNWPTKIVWSGYEIGADLLTGDTISSTHPSDSPVRVAYEAFFNNGPNT